MRVLIRCFWIGIGYGAAALTATTICMIVNQLLAGVWPNVGATLLLILAAAPVLGLKALPLAALAIVASEFTTLRTWLYFGLVGIAIGHFVASGFNVNLFNREGNVDYNYITAILAALIAGVVYWRVTVDDSAVGS